MLNSLVSSFLWHFASRRNNARITKVSTAVKLCRSMGYHGSFRRVTQLLKELEQIGLGEVQQKGKERYFKWNDGSKELCKIGFDLLSERKF